MEVKIDAVEMKTLDVVEMTVVGSTLIYVRYLIGHGSEGH
jgi:hypothetical protein